MTLTFRIPTLLLRLALLLAWAGLAVLGAGALVLLVVTARALFDLAVLAAGEPWALVPIGILALPLVLMFVGRMVESVRLARRDVSVD